MLLKVSEQDLAHIKALLRIDGMNDLADRLTASVLNQGQALTALAEADTDPNSPAFIEAARKIWADDDVEIDDDPLTSRAEHGCWVSAWVWVSNEAVGLGEDDDAD